jgi:hypothetical protein
MPRCPVCGYRLPPDEERLGARCPHCRRPLYEPPGRLAKEAEPGDAVCAAHPGSAAVGTCGRCGDFLCATCRTRWGDSALCVACTERALRSASAGPAGEGKRDRRAAFGLAGGVGAWVLTGLVVGVALLAQLGRSEEPNPLMALAGLLILFLGFSSVVLALAGLGLSAAALRVRGDNMILATLGLFLSGLHVGALVGLFLFEVWQL